MRGFATYYTDPLTTRDKKYLPMIQVTSIQLQNICLMHILFYLYMLLLQYKRTCVLTKRP
jgi:hypothetical protein